MITFKLQLKLKSFNIVDRLYLKLDDPLPIDFSMNVVYCVYRTGCVIHKKKILLCCYPLWEKNDFLPYTQRSWLLRIVIYTADTYVNLCVCVCKQNEIIIFSQNFNNFLLVSIRNLIYYHFQIDQSSVIASLPFFFCTRDIK